MLTKAERWLMVGGVALAWVLGCASTRGTGSETHFTACENAADCPAAEPYCVEKRCERAPASDGGDADGSPADAACGALPPAVYRCTQFCGSDRSGELECRDGAWRCPDRLPIRADQCPEDTCWFPGATCCSNDGSLVAGSCPGGGQMVCPPGSAPRGADGECTAACLAASDPPPGPHPVTFRFTNEGGAHVALWESCVLTHAVTACVDGFATPLATWTFCAPQCGAGTGCPVCGACPDEPRVVEGGSTVELEWRGTLFTLGTEQGCACSIANDAPAGTYRITVPVYSRAPLAQPGGGYYRTALYEVSENFTLPVPGGIVEVPLDRSPYLGPCPGPGLCVMPVSPDAAESGCHLEPSPESDCPATAPRRFRCERPVPLPADCVASPSEVAGASGPEGVLRCCSAAP